jgi:hypothetical protein
MFWMPNVRPSTTEVAARRIDCSSAELAAQSLDSH